MTWLLVRLETGQPLRMPSFDKALAHGLKRTAYQRPAGKMTEYLHACSNYMDGG